MNTRSKMSKKPWKKVLYDRQGVHDNYVDETFLSNLQKDLKGHKIPLCEAIVKSGRLSHEISCSCFFILAFIYLQDEDAGNDLNKLLTVGCFILVLAASAVLFISFVISQDKTKVWIRARDITVYLLFGYGFSPLLKNLTETISTDTIYAMVTLMMLAHLAFQDYGASAAIVSSTLSLNASLFAAVCLASRLPSIPKAFALLTLAAELFAVNPVYHRWALTLSIKWQIVSVLVTILPALALTMTVSLFFTFYLAMTILLLNVVCPALFVHWQSHKENISGPWDEAKPLLKEKHF